MCCLNENRNDFNNTIIVAKVEEKRDCKSPKDQGFLAHVLPSLGSNALLDMDIINTALERRARDGGRRFRCNVHQPRARLVSPRIRSAFRSNPKTSFSRAEYPRD